MDRQNLVTYYVLLSVVTMLTSSWICEYLAENIRLGKLSPILLRPTPEIANAIANNLGEKIVKLVFLLPMIGVMAVVFGRDLVFPTDPIAWVLFVICMPTRGRHRVYDRFSDRIARVLDRGRSWSQAGSGLSSARFSLDRSCRLPSFPHG